MSEKVIAHLFLGANSKIWALSFMLSLFITASTGKPVPELGEYKPGKTKKKVHTLNRKNLENCFIFSHFIN